MLKIGDRVKFNSYLPKNMVTGRQLMKSLDKKKKARGDGFHVRKSIVKDNTIHMTANVIEGDELSGIFLGTFRKKLVRIYRKKSAEQQVEELREDMLNPFAAVRRRGFRDYRVDRYSVNNPNRLDNPRELDTIAMVRVNRVVVGVPMENLLKYTYGRKTLTI